MTDSIKNRMNTGMCPMEKAVQQADSAQEAFHILQEKMMKQI